MNDELIEQLPNALVLNGIEFLIIDFVKAFDMLPVFDEGDVLIGILLEFR
jgi:hypothetical protein